MTDRVEEEIAAIERDLQRVHEIRAGTFVREDGLIRRKTTLQDQLRAERGETLFKSHYNGPPAA